MFEAPQPIGTNIWLKIQFKSPAGVNCKMKAFNLQDPHQMYPAHVDNAKTELENKRMRLILDPKSGAIFELYSKTGNSDANEVSAIHADIGAALQFALHESNAERRFLGPGNTIPPIGDDFNLDKVNYTNPNQAGVYGYYQLNEDGKYINKYPATGCELKRIRPSGTTKVNTIDGITQAVTGPFRWLFWNYLQGGDFGLTDEGECPPMTSLSEKEPNLTQTLKLHDDYFLVEGEYEDLHDTQSRVPFIEMPAMYFTTGFRKVWLGTSGGSVLHKKFMGDEPIEKDENGDSITVPLTTTTDIKNGVFYSGTGNWISVQHENFPDLKYTVAWFDTVAASFSAPTAQVMMFPPLSNFKVGHYRFFNKEPNTKYKFTYAVFLGKYNDPLSPAQPGGPTVIDKINELSSQLTSAPEDPPSECNAGFYLHDNRCLQNPSCSLAVSRTGSTCSVTLTSTGGTAADGAISRKAPGASNWENTTLEGPLTNSRTLSLSCPQGATAFGGMVRDYNAQAITCSVPAGGIHSEVYCDSGFILNGSQCVAQTCTPNASQSQACAVSNGSGTQSRTCNSQG
ncbi:MAG: hypothetical protein EB120_05650, partial [Proteobacteria bacterium]|nr:hypothetical protein [Pseudomonadota bacterium]